MSSVDDSIVEMKFDNVKFQQKMEETIRSLDKLRVSLDFAAGQKSMGDLSKAAKDFNVNPMGTSLEDVSRKFLALSTVALTVLSQITQAAFTSGLSVVKAFTLAPITSGFQEFETNMNSIQTILANTKSDGSNLRDVNAALDEMNHYSDKTIYNFSQMARNVGTFTAAGVNLQDSTNAIKGIANLAAISGSSADQASTAMYQLSQALAAGKVSLMDWNSVVNAGMGGEVFKKALFETGKAMGTITDVPLGASFEEWEKKGGTFREQMQKGWITADVLKTSLGAFSGELDASALSALGFSDAAAQEMVDLGKLGVAAATEVKTLTQLIGTVKEAVGSGWSMTFRTVIGDFAESKKLFTEINNAIGGFVSKSADARNQLLAEWKFMGGRTLLIEGLKNAFGALGNVFTAVKDAFRNIFPKTTSAELFSMTESFANFTERLRELTENWMPKIMQGFQGFFSVISIGWEIIKGLARVIKAIFGEIVDALGGPSAGLISKVAGGLSDLRKTLVVDGGIKDFFDTLIEGIRKPAEFIDKLVEGIGGLMDALRGGGETDALDGVNDRLGRVGEMVKSIGDAWDWLVEKTEGVRQAIGDLWNYITQFFRELGDSMKSEMNQNDFEGALDIFNVAFLGGIALMIRNFFKNGFGNLGGNIIEKINGILTQTTGVLKAMQTELKAKALMEIAIAMGVLTLALVGLSMINSADLTKALVAMSVGFAQLIGAMVAIEKLTSMTGAFRFSVVAAGMILLAGAMVILAAAMKIMATMSWSELAKGLIGVAGGLAIMITGINLLTSDTSGLIRAGISMIAIAVALRILANAMQAFATMGWEELAKGLIGVAGGLTALVTAMNFMPVEGMVQAGISIIAIAVGMRILANAMQAFATMSWTDIAKGLTGVALGLGAIVLITNTMPAGGMIAIGVGLIAVSAALLIMAQAVKSMSDLDLGEMVKGIGGLAAMMLILVVATNAMTGAMAGAAAMIIVAGAVLIMSKVLQEIGRMDIKELIIGLVGLAAVLALLGGAAYLLTPVIPAMLGLGIAIGLLGAGFALFGAGAYLTIKALELLSKVGVDAMKVLIEMIAIFVARAPLIGIAIARVVVAAATDLAEAAPTLIKALKVVLLELLEAVIELAPKIGEAFGAILTVMLGLLEEFAPQIIEAGFNLLMDFMRGIRDNTQELVTVGAEILVNLMQGLADKASDLVNAAVDLLQSFLGVIGERAGDVVAAGIKLLVDFLAGVVQNISDVITTATDIVIEFVTGIVQNLSKIISAGANLLVKFLFGVTRDILKVADAVTTIVVAFVTRMGENANKIITAGVDALIDFLSGITDNAIKVVEAVSTMVAQFIYGVGANASKIVTAGTDALIDFLSGVRSNSTRAVNAIATTGLHVMNAIGNAIVFTVDKAAQILLDFLRKLRTAIDRHAEEIGQAGRQLAGAIINGITGGLGARAGDVVNKIRGIAGDAVGGAMDFLGIGGPSKVFCEIGKATMMGWAGGIESKGKVPEKKAQMVASNVVDIFQKSLGKATASLPALDDLNPVITPVLDLSKVRKEATNLDKMMDVASIIPDVSIERARVLAFESNVQNGSSDETPEPNGPVENTFIQNNYSPQALSTADIYRQTKSQFALAKEELGVA